MAEKMEGVVSGGAAGLLDPSKYPVPIETLYVNGLEERIKVPLMEETLRVLFNYVGPIMDIIIKTSLKRKGQAFIVFDGPKSDLQKAFLLDGFEFYGKKMRVQIAKTHSDATVKTKAPELFEEHKRKRLMAKDFKRAEEDAKVQANSAAAAEKPRAVKSGAAAVPDEYVRPNKTLLLQNIPADVDEEALTEIFERFQGFNEVRVLRAKAVGFAEFENEQFAIHAKEATANKPVGAEGKPMKVTYARQ